MSRFWIWCVVVLACEVSVPARAEEAIAAQEKPATVPIQAGLQPEAAAAHMTALEGFRVQLAAAEPMVHQPVAMAFSRAFTLMGAPGAGQLTKMVNQICIAGLVQGLSEAIAFGQKAGLDMKLVLEVIGKGAAQSWQLDNRGKTMVADQFGFGFAVDWMRKDLGLVLDEAKRNGARLPVTALVDQFYAELQRRGHRRLDTSSLIKLLRQS